MIHKTFIAKKKRILFDETVDGEWTDREPWNGYSQDFLTNYDWTKSPYADP